MKRPHFIFKVEKGVATVDPESLIDFVGYTDHLEAENKELKDFIQGSLNNCHDNEFVLQEFIEEGTELLKKCH